MCIIGHVTRKIGQTGSPCPSVWKQQFCGILPQPFTKDLLRKLFIRGPLICPRQDLVKQSKEFIFCPFRGIKSLITFLPSSTHTRRFFPMLQKIFYFFR